jgi:hypothetical protein
MSQIAKTSKLDCSREKKTIKYSEMSCIRPPFQAPYSIASAKQKAKKYSRKFMQEFVETTSIPVH